MTALEKYFDHIVVINLVSRPDRLRHALLELAALGITKYTIFEAHDRPIDDSGRPSGNMGCTASHRGVLELICHHRWQRTLILEDDCTVRSLFVAPKNATHPYLGSVQDNFSRWVAEVPDDWAMLYLGGHYGEDGKARVSAHVIRCGRMLTTSSYGITLAHARRLAPYIAGVGPIDNLMSKFHDEGNAYIFTPRFFVQYTNRSDLQDREMENATCMEDGAHESRLPWNPPRK